MNLEQVTDIKEIEQMAEKLSTCRDFKLVLAELLICSQLNQLVKFTGGFVGWFRWNMESKKKVENGEIPLHELKSDGEVLQIVSFYAPGLSYQVVRLLSKLKGIKTIFGNTGNRWREVTCLG